ncbi:MAG: hypothetical protein OEW58_05190 [Gammaproteobacteria bacterium]|nr:hypothetical protein [Gammaproteobacteria bacterium]
MSQPQDKSLIHCNNCHFEGKVHASGAKQFALFMLMLAASAYFLPMIVVALAYMIFILSQSPKRMCPKCKSTNLTPISALSATEKTEKTSTANGDQAA